MSAWSASPVYICRAERGWSVSAAAPASTSRGADSRARPRAVLEAAPHLHRDRDGDRASRRLRSRSGRRGRDRRAGSPRRPSSSPSGPGQPKLTSTMSAPAASTIRAASAMTAGLGAEDLDRERMLVGRDQQIAERALVAVRQAGAAHHLGAHETGAEPPSLTSERLHADACHRREHEPARHFDGADPPGVPKVDPASGMVAGAPRFHSLTRGEAMVQFVGARCTAPRFFCLWGLGGTCEGSHPDS